ncbi:MAG TPA: CoA transferase [Dehalococcoidia bacterium]|nr:CoA transferase [Dehalococcoidia bacterium]
MGAERNEIGPALDGLRVLDLTQVAAGPYSTMLLAFMGAEVIKVESCSRMDINRGRARPAPGDTRVYPGGEPGERPWNRAAHHVHRNINKLSVTLDLGAPRGKELFLDLARICDVLVENYRASVMDRLGLGYDAVSQANPQLIYVKISSQGDSGPERDYGSLGSTLEQTAGLASVTGYEGGPPLMTNETYPDPVVGILAFGALMAALRQRRATGRGCLVDLSQREVTSMLLGEAFLDYSANGRVAGTMGNRHWDMSPHGVYPCLGDDMWAAISVSAEDEWLGLCRCIGQPQLARDSRFQDLESRRRNQAELDQIISTWTLEKEHYQVMHMLQAHGVPAGAVLKANETLADPHLEDRGFWDVVDHPEAGTYKQTTTPWILSKNPRLPAIAAAGLGEHNFQVFNGLLGLSPGEIDDLVESGIAGYTPSDGA